MAQVLKMFYIQSQNTLTGSEVAFYFCARIFIRMFVFFCFFLLVNFD